MNYYNPYLGSWIEDAAGQSLATESAQAAAIFSDLLSTSYATAGIPMADVYASFESDDFVNIVPSSLPMSPAIASSPTLWRQYCPENPYLVVHKERQQVSANRRWWLH